MIDKFGVSPASIPDYLALVGDSADGFPGVPRWGAKSAAGVLACFGRLEAIPLHASAWQVDVRGADGLATALRDHWEDALLFRDLATLRTDAPLFDDVEELRWRGPAPEFAEVCRRLGAADLQDEVAQLTPSGERPA